MGRKEQRPVAAGRLIHSARKIPLGEIPKKRPGKRIQAESSGKGFPRWQPSQRGTLGENSPI